MLFSMFSCLESMAYKKVTAQRITRVLNGNILTSLGHFLLHRQPKNSKNCLTRRTCVPSASPAAAMSLRCFGLFLFEIHLFSFYVHECLLMCVYITCMSGGNQKRMSELLEVKFQVAMHCHVGAENQTWDFSKSGKHSLPLTQLFNPRASNVLMTDGYSTPE